jgi:hypothetical protein
MGNRDARGREKRKPKKKEIKQTGKPSRPVTVYRPETVYKPVTPQQPGQTGEESS